VVGTTDLREPTFELHHRDDGNCGEVLATNMWALQHPGKTILKVPDEKKKVYFQSQRTKRKWRFIYYVSCILDIDFIRAVNSLSRKWTSVLAE
jgi:hypothetical protein